MAETDRNTAGVSERDAPGPSPGGTPAPTSASAAPGGGTSATDPTALHVDHVSGGEAPTPAGEGSGGAGGTLAVLPGIYGAGRNWSTVARRVVEKRPEWRAALVDLRGHGQSPGMAEPHTVEAAAEDVLRTLGPVRAILGHSFGGKVALAYARLAAEREPGALEQVWVVDSTPEARDPDGSAWDMLGHLRAVEGPFGSRSEGVAALEDRGMPTTVARWMATNLEEDERGQWRWRLDVDQMEALLEDFFATDAWDVIESPPAGVTVHLVKATGSDVLSPGGADRVLAAGRESGRVHLHRVQGGHWLNADNPDALVALLEDGLP